MENCIRFFRSQIWPKQVVRMSILSMKNNFEYLFTISRVADRSGPPPEHADYSILHFQKWRKSMENRQTRKICRSVEAIQVQWEEYWACWDLVLTIQTHYNRFIDISGPMGTNKPLRNMPIIHISTFWDWKKKQSQKHKKYNIFVCFGLVLLPEMPYVCQHLFQAYIKYIGCE